ncbi:MAG: tetratricopeptide repeat protein [Candidatus Zophobacter franzmannii]|jgi:tetratricopeptide (TPR) repeat protein|nr:tetratricopeptide repeat protein [Candidatus Zophobacter franzmannii]
MKKVLVIVILSLMSLLLLAQAQSPLSRSYTYESKYQYTAAIEAMQSLYTNSQDDVFVNLRLGWLYYLNADYDNAVKHYETAYDQEKCLEAIEGLVSVAYMQGEWEKVIASSDEILKKYPHNTSVRFKKAYSFFALKDWNKAAKSFNEVLKVYPYDLDSRCYLLACQLYSGDMMNAKKTYSFVIQYSPACPYIAEYEATRK